tara:strand:+ start:1924 stop:2802 length:879 start_codon:yes stop_codon:yes gene_type:complete
MPSLKDLRNRISSVKSTKKITSAMKMVAAAKLKRAQTNAEQTRPYAEKIKEIVDGLSNNVNQNSFKYSPKSSSKKDKNILLIVCSADRGLCGGFNSSIIKFTKNLSDKIVEEGNKPMFIFIGKKAHNSLKRFYSESILDFYSDFANPVIKFDLSIEIRDKILELFQKGEIDESHIIFTKFKSAISQNVHNLKLLPIEKKIGENTNISKIHYEYEPNEEHVLNEIIPKNLAIQIHSGLLENLASEQGSRMTAMDNATRNANDMIDNLTLFYNRSRQALITKELIEIISGAEAI